MDLDNLDNLDFDSAEDKVQKQSVVEQTQAAVVPDNDCGDSCTI